MTIQFFKRRLSISFIRLLVEGAIVYFVVKSYPDLSWLWYVVIGLEASGLLILATFWFSFNKKKEKLTNKTDQLFELVNQKLEDRVEHDVIASWSKTDSELDEPSKSLQIESAQLSDHEMRNLMLGRWSSDMERSNVKVQGWNEFLENGTFESKMKITNSGEQGYCFIRGRWYLSERVIHWEVKDSSNSDMVPVGLEVEDQILVITENDLIYKDQDGSLIREHRI